MAASVRLTRTLATRSTTCHSDPLISFADYVTMQEYDAVLLEVQGLKEQLIGTLEELAAREREVGELHDTSLRYHTKMQTLSDQVKLLYREYSGALTAWKVEKNTLDKKVCTV